MRKLLATVLAVGLVSCASTSQVTPAKSLYLVEDGLTGAMQVATVYAGLPTCGAGVPNPCSDPATVARIDAAAETATTAVLAAQSANPQTQAQALAQATIAVQALTALTSQVKVK